MGRIALASPPFSPETGKHGDALPGRSIRIKTIAGADATVYDAETVGAVTSAVQTTDADGYLPENRWVEAGVYLVRDEKTGKERRVDAVPGADLPSVETRVANLDTSDATMDDAVSIAVPATKLRRIPIADKAVYDLREFYAGTSQPADVLGHIHDGLAKTAVAGGSLLIPDSEEPWDITAPIVPPFNSRMHGPTQARYSERQSLSGHGTAPYQLPVSPNSIGDAWIRLAAGSNCPILTNDYANAVSKRGPDQGNGSYFQWFTAKGIVFDHNGRSQTGALIAIDIRDAWGISFSFCRLVEPRGQGWVLNNCNECDGEKNVLVGQLEDVANGVGDISIGSPTILNAGGTWAVGDLIRGLAGVPIGTYVSVVAGSTLTLAKTSDGTAQNATATATATALTKRTPSCTAALVLKNTTTDSEWLGCSMHGAADGLVIDGAYGNRVNGQFGYSIGGYNARLRDTGATGKTFGNKVDVRLEQATKHNLRIDSAVVSNVVDVVAYQPGLYATPNDGDNGWCNVFCDGTKNVLRGTGRKAGTALGGAPNMANVVGYGPNAVDNRGEITGGDDLTASTRIYRYETGASPSNSNPAPPPFFIPSTAFVAADGTTPAMADFNGTLHRVLSFADGATNSAVAYFTVPYGCRKVLLRPEMVNLAAANSGNVRIQLGYADAAGAQTPGGDEQTGGPSTVAVAANSVVVQTTFSGQQFTAVPGDLVAIRFKRIGADAADTLISALGLVGVRVEPMLIA